MVPTSPPPAFVPRAARAGRPSSREIACRRCGRWTTQGADMRWRHADGSLACADPATLQPYPTTGCGPTTGCLMSVSDGGSPRPTQQETDMTSTETASPAPAEMTTARLREALRAAGRPYSGKDSKADLVARLEAAQALADLPAPDEDGLAAFRQSFVDEPSGLALTKKLAAEAAAPPASQTAALLNAEGEVVGTATFTIGEALATSLGPDPDDLAARRVERLAAVKEEEAALREWEKGERVDPRPATPNLDAVTTAATKRKAKAEGKAPARAPRAPKAKAEAPAKAPRTKLQFFIDGKPVPAVHSTLAGTSRATALRKGERLSTEALRALLVKSGIAEPDASAWEFTLPNGVVLSTKKLS